MPEPSDGVTAEFFPARADIVLPRGVLGPESFSFNVNAFVLRRGNNIALIDTLMRPDHSEVILGALGHADAGFADINYIVLTHHHPDHSGGLATINDRSPQAQILCGAADIDALRGSTGITADAVEDGDTVVGLDVIPTPGHTPGHLCLFDRDSSTMFLGDLGRQHRRSAAHATAVHREHRPGRGIVARLGRTALRECFASAWRSGARRCLSITAPTGRRAGGVIRWQSRWHNQLGRWPRRRRPTIWRPTIWRWRYETR